MHRQKIVFIVGPTAVGKTEVALKLAQLCSCEFISADSMQIYRGMDIITAKSPTFIRRKYPHHLIDIVNPTQTYNVADFCQQAHRVIASILRRKKLPIVIGGTGLYVNSLLYGIFKGPSRDAKLRQRFEGVAQEKGSGFLYEQLKEVDPEAASRIKSSDLKRITRALEVYEITQQPISLQQKDRTGLTDEYKVLIFGLRRDRSDLYRRIEQRVDFMLNSGLLNEVKNLLKQKLSLTAYMCIGIREIEGFLKGKYDLDEAVQLVKGNSRRFAKRQITWFNKNKDIHWIDLKEDEDILLAARKIFHQVSKIEDRNVL